MAFLTTAQLLVLMCLVAIASLAEAVSIGVDGKAFVDGVTTNNWVTGKAYKALKVFKGVEVKFAWNGVNHDVSLAPNVAAFNKCAVSPSTQLAPFATTGTYTFTTADKALGKYYVYCTAPNHCKMKQKVAIQVVAAPKCSTAKTAPKCALIPNCTWSGTACA